MNQNPMNPQSMPENSSGYLSPNFNSQGSMPAQGVPGATYGTPQQSMPGSGYLGQPMPRQPYSQQPQFGQPMPAWQGSAPQPKSNKTMIIAIIAVVAVVLFALIMFFFFKGGFGSKTMNSTGKTYSKDQVRKVLKSELNRNLRDINAKEIAELLLQRVEFSEPSDKDKAIELLSKEKGIVKATASNGNISVSLVKEGVTFDKDDLVSYAWPLDFLNKHKKEFKGSFKIPGYESKKDKNVGLKELSQGKTKSGYKYIKYGFQGSDMDSEIKDYKILFSQVDNLIFVGISKSDDNNLKTKFEESIDKVVNKLKK